jgi:nicotinate-nucleotide--dimethylbenzimidazole phosphoribosyltransferase
VTDHLKPPDSRARAAATTRLDELTKPKGSLGRLEEVAIWAAGVQGACPPQPFRKPSLVIFVGDHGVARTIGTSAYPPEVTAQMVRSFVAGTAAVNAIAGVANVDVRVVDVSVDADPDYLADVAPQVAAHRIRRGTGSIHAEDAMSSAEAQAAFDLGARIADEHIDAGADLLIAGDMGIGNTTPAAALVGVITKHNAAAVTGLGTGIDDATWMRKAGAIRDAMRRGREVRDDPMALLATVSGPDFAAIAGFLHRSALRRTPVILDGTISTAAALVVDRIEPKARLWWLAGHRSAEPAHGLALERLGLEPLLDMEMRLGEGTGAVLALPIVQAAITCIAQMNTFDEAGVSK